MDINKLKGHIPDKVLVEIPSVMEKFFINNPLRLAHFLSQTAHESWDFTATRENLNYSAEALQRVFGKHFPDDLEKQYAHQPEKIGNRVYANRLGNGSESSGDGFKYRGGGYIQLTGKINYIAFDKVVPEDIVAQPELVATKYPLLSAAWFWSTRNLNALADQGSTPKIVTKVTHIINGGENGLAERQANFIKYYNLLK
jgi:putative chitinase